MNNLGKNNYSRFVICNLARYGLTALLGIVEVGESVSAIAESAGVEVTQREANSNQAIRLQAEKLTKEGFQLFQQGTAESLKQALGKFESALILWRKVEDKQLQVITMLAIGRINDSLGYKEKALKLYNQTLPLSRKIGNKSLEATTLISIGLAYNSLGYKQQALKFFNQALPLTREVRDKNQEASTLNNIGGIYSNLGDKQQALKFYNQALPFFAILLGYTETTAISKQHSPIAKHQSILLKTYGLRLIATIYVHPTLPPYKIPTNSTSTF